MELQPVLTVGDYTTIHKKNPNEVRLVVHRKVLETWNGFRYFCESAKNKKKREKMCEEKRRCVNDIVAMTRWVFTHRRKR